MICTQVSPNASKCTYRDNSDCNAYTMLIGDQLTVSEILLDGEQS